MKYLKNCWYMVGWGKDFQAGEIVPFTLLDEAVILYRKADGSMAALEDRCCHRLAPLSSGRLEGDEVRCLYHGLKFNAGGGLRRYPRSGAYLVPGQGPGLCSAGTSQRDLVVDGRGAGGR